MTAASSTSPAHRPAASTRWRRGESLPAAYGLAARLARREVLRRPWRTVLVALLVAFPVAGMTMAVVLFRTDSLSAQQQWTLEYGNADALIDTTTSSTGVALPEGSRSITVRDTGERGLRTADGTRFRAAITDVALDDPITTPVVRLDEGRPPSAAGEVLLSPSVAGPLHIHVGDILQLDRPTAKSVTVVGIGQLRANLDARVIVVAPGTSLLGASGGSAFTYVALDGTTDSAGAAASLGDSARLAPRFDDRPTFADGKSAAVRGTWILGGLVLTVVGIVIASAFAASARRQLTTLGQLAANGASPDVLRRALFFQGTWTGVVGTVSGFGLGVVGLVVLDPHVDGLFQRDVGSYVVRVTDLVPIAVIGTAVATIAALVPARTTSRIPVLAALAGRRPLTKVPRWVTVGGFASIAAGLGLLGLAVIGATHTNGPGTQRDQNVWAATAVLGGMSVLLGACAIAPAYVSLLDRASSRLSGSWRFAARSLARQRTRTGAVVSGLCAAGALAIGASALVIGAVSEQQQRDARLPHNEVHISAVSMDAAREEVTATPDASLVADVAAVLPGAQRVDLTAVPVHDGRVAVVADAAALDVYDLGADAQRALADGGAIELRLPDEPDQQRPQQQFTEGGPTVDVTSVTTSPEGVWDLPHVLVSPALVEQLGLTTGTGPVVLRADHDLTDDEVGAIEDLRDDYYAAHPDDDPTPVPVPGGGERKVVRAGIAHHFTFVQTFTESDTVDAFVVEAILSAIAVGFALIVVAVSLALAAAETRDERDVLAIVGAAPATMRRTSAQKAAILTVMGGLLAIPVGFLPVVVFTRADRIGGPLLVFPWRTVAVLLVAVPVITTVATAAASALALRLRPVRVSTMTFE